MKVRPNGLLIGRKKVPLGVIAIIYEARRMSPWMRPSSV
jgi:glutamate-5-semialdehyde dehydrogenase